jgi:hypothetical protein
VRPWDSTERHTILSLRQQLTPTHYALYAENSGTDNDWTVSGNDMHSNTSGNIGIGTTAPTAKLELAGDLKMAIEDDIVLSLVSGITNSSKIALGQRFNNESAVIELDNTTGLLRFGRPFESNSLTIDGSGNVGVGTASPEARLNIEQNIGAWGEGIRLSYGGHDWDFVTDNGGERLHIAQNETTGKGLTIFDGRVSIGTTNPQAMLDVNGIVHASGEITREFTTGTSNLVTPIAYAFINSDGTVASGTPNVSSIWNTTINRYDITISNENYISANYVTLVTPTTGSCMPSTTSLSGKLSVYFWHPAGGSPIQTSFQFVTYKP